MGLQDEQISQGSAFFIAKSGIVKNLLGLLAGFIRI